MPVTRSSTRKATRLSIRKAKTSTFAAPLKATQARLKRDPKRYFMMKMQDPTTKKISNVNLDRYEEFSGALLSKDQAYAKYID